MSYRETIEKLNQSAGRPRACEPHELSGMNTFIQPELLAAKLKASADGEFPAMAEQLVERPRLREAMCFVQWHSYQPGGLCGLAEKILDSFPERLGFAELRSVRPATKSGLSDVQIDELLEKVTWGRSVIQKALGDGRYESALSWMGERARAERLVETLPAWERAEAWDRLDATTPEVRAIGNTRPIRHPEEWLNLARKEFRRHTPQYLADLCQSSAVNCDHADTRFWFFEGFIDALIEHLDRHAAHVWKEIADTTVRRKLVSELDFVQSKGGSVLLIGETRHGKSWGALNRCKMRPGVMRYSEIPSGRDLAALDRTLVKSVGIVPTPSKATHHLRYLAEFVYKHTGLMAVLDEAQRLYPAGFTSRSRPPRLDLVRSAFMDNDVPTAFIMTPQGEKEWKRFDQYTGFNADQFYGRIHTIPFPKELPEEDVEKVAEYLFAEYPRELAVKVAGRACQTRTSLKAVQLIHKRAHWNAEKDGRDRLTFADVQLACDEMVPRGRIESSGDSDQETGRCAPAAATPPPPCSATAASPRDTNFQGQDRHTGAPEKPRHQEKALHKLT